MNRYYVYKRKCCGIISTYKHLKWGTKGQPEDLGVECYERKNEGDIIYFIRNREWIFLKWHRVMKFKAKNVKKLKIH